ncbi:MAG: hypothetical protein AAFV69_10515, partial [Pseudomonadota bacterium]
MLAWLIAILVALVGLFYVLTADAGVLAEYGVTDRWALVIAMVMMAVFAFTLLGTYAGRAGTALKHASIWLAIIIGLVGLYAFREEFTYVGSRVAGELLPAGSGITVRDEKTGEVAVRIRQRND